jgi:hypothetical protein
MAKATTHEVIVKPEIVIPAEKETHVTLLLDAHEARVLLTLVGMLGGSFAGRRATDSIFRALRENGVGDEPARLRNYRRDRGELLNGLEINSRRVDLDV